MLSKRNSVVPLIPTISAGVGLIIFWAGLFLPVDSCFAQRPGAPGSQPPANTGNAGKVKESYDPPDEAGRKPAVTPNDSGDAKAPPNAPPIDKAKSATSAMLKGNDANNAASALAQPGKQMDASAINNFNQAMAQKNLADMAFEKDVKSEKYDNTNADKVRALKGLQTLATLQALSNSMGSSGSGGSGGGGGGASRSGTQTPEAPSVPSIDTSAPAVATAPDNGFSVTMDISSGSRKSPSSSGNDQLVSLTAPLAPPAGPADVPKVMINLGGGSRLVADDNAPGSLAAIKDGPTPSNGSGDSHKVGFSEAGANTPGTFLMGGNRTVAADGSAAAGADKNDSKKLLDLARAVSVLNAKKKGKNGAGDLAKSGSGGAGGKGSGFVNPLLATDSPSGGSLFGSGREIASVDGTGDDDASADIKAPGDVDNRPYLAPNQVSAGKRSSLALPNISGAFPVGVTAILLAGIFGAVWGLRTYFGTSTKRKDDDDNSRRAA